MISSRIKYLLALCFITSITCAQNSTEEIDTLKQITVSGSVDAYYHKAFRRMEHAPKTSFANLPGFSLGMVNLVFEYSSRKAGCVADLVLGPRGSDAIFNAPMYKNGHGGSSSQIINQMYVYYRFNNSFRVSVGQFNTFLSYELISPTKNFHYSTSYLFSYGPFNHTGIWADINLKNNWSAKLACMNPTDYTEYNPFDSYTLGGQISYAGNHGTTSLNITYGDPDGDLRSKDSVGTTSSGKALHVDFVSSLNLTKKYSLGLSASVRSIGIGQVKIDDNTHAVTKQSAFYGGIIYQTLRFSPAYSIGLRTEYFREMNGGVGALGIYNASGVASVLAATLSANLKNGDFYFIPEIRIDKTSANSFHALNNTPTSTMVSINIAVVYVLPSLVRKIKS